ncbi:MAG: 4-hydroxyphenylacetate 3-hydroxylase N-terminal domain-containing protein, partial [Luminiphilus sp.]
MLMKAGGRIMSAAEYTESLRSYSPTVYVDGDRIASVADEPRLQPGIRAVGVTYDFAQKPEYGGLMLAEQSTSGKTVNRMLHINRHS